MSLSNIPVCACSVLGLVLISAAAGADSGQQLWREFMQSPTYNHSHLPDFSWAGYGFGEVELPEPQVVANVRDHGAAGDGQADDTEAFRAAIAAAKEAGGGAILIPAGRYRLTGVVGLDDSNLVLRGEGVGRTTLFFERPLDEAVHKITDGSGQSWWSWSGGLVWVGPEGALDDEGRLRTEGGWERWRDTQELGAVAAPAEQGAFEITVDESTAERLASGDLVLLNWHDPSDRSLLEFIGGHETMEQAQWNRLAGATFRWPVEIESVEGRTVTLRKPLRLPVRDGWNVLLTTPGPHVREVGVEHLTILFPRTQRKPHNRYPGYNGIYIQKAVQCWVRDVRIINADNGILTTSVANCTITGFAISGRPIHHGTYSKDTHDVLFDDFHIQAQCYHGINAEGLASGVLWRRGRIDHGTFDSHRNMPFDLLREQIRLNSKGRPGGASNAGPSLGRRAVHWNVTVTGGNADWVASPDYMPNGALVGIRGTDIRRVRNPWAMPAGDKGCIVIDHGKVPNPPSLYEAQLQRRLNQD